MVVVWKREEVSALETRAEVIQVDGGVKIQESDIRDGADRLSAAGAVLWADK